MAVFNEPSKWQTSLVNSGDANTIPQNTPAGTGNASFEDGFPQITQVPIGAGGIAPDRKDFNGLFKILGDWIFFLQNGGLSTYSANFDYVVGRYVVYNNTLYKCIQANGVSSTVVAPDSVSPLGSDYWKDIENQDSTSLIPNQTIVSELPLTDANLHLKDGALLSGSGAYSEYVDLIAEIYNGGSASSSFCTEAEWQTSNTNYGFCNKFVYDSVANTVRLPKINSEHGALIKSYSNGYNWYRIYQDGWCEQGLSKTPNAIGTWTFSVPFSDTNYTVLQSNRDNSNGTQAMMLFNYTTISVEYSLHTTTGYQSLYACGYVDISGLQTAPVYEYIVVGTVSKTDIQIDIDNVMADLALKADTDLSNVPSSKGILVESYVNGASWYRVYSDGWCEQGGYATASGSNASVTYLKAFNSTDYTLTFGIISNVTNNCYLAHVGEYANTTHASSTGFTALAFSQKAFNWMACGYIS